MSLRKKVLVVDDSITVCRYLEAVFMNDPDLEVVGYALSAEEARQKIKDLSPDVLTLDVKMPGMDGLNFLRNLMRLHPMPVVMFSSLTQIGARESLDALEIGAVDFMPKRSGTDGWDTESYLTELKERVKLAADVTIKKPQRTTQFQQLPDLDGCIRKFRISNGPSYDFEHIVAIGASTGGTEAMKHVMQDLHVNRCVLVLSQHMPALFVASFAQRINSASAFDIRIAVHDEKLVMGRGYIAPGDQHLAIKRKPDGLYWQLLSTPRVSGHRPSVNVLFKSLAEHAAQHTLAALLTGMGDDGAEGLLSLRQGGAVTFAQDKESSVVWGMPGRAVDLDAADLVLGLSQMGPAINTLMR